MKYSIVVPLYNEELSLKILIEKLKQVFQKDWGETELIFVNDGSTDSSRQILEKLQKKYTNLKLINFRTHQGKSEGLNAGFQAAEGEIVVTLDADLQDEPTEIPKLLKKLATGYDVVSGWKKHRRDPKNRLVLTKIFNSVVRKLTKVDLNDFNCGLKVYRNQVVKEIHVYGELHRFIPVLAAHRGFSVGEVAVIHNERLFGESKYNWTRIPQGFFDLFTILFLNKFKKSPMYFFGGVGLVLFSLGFLAALDLTILHFQGIAINRLFYSKL